MDMPSARTDIHFHLLPGVDDGPATLADSIQLAREAVAEGTGTVVATPHVRGDWVTDVALLRERVREVKAALAEKRIPLSVVQGAELGHDMVGRLRQEELASVAQGPPGRRWLLVEAPWTGLDAGFRAATDELRDRGFAVVVGHPERSPGLFDTHRAGLEHELAAGSALQLNAFSLTGAHGPEAHGAALRLIELGVVAAVASDAHGGARRPALTDAYEAMRADGVAAGVARALVDSGPRRLMARGVELVPAPLV
jgi:protein-tyrosine phosphatase